MATGVPVRLSAQLAERARKAAELQDRSLTQQVEHWARLGEIMEAAINGSTERRLKGASYDPKLKERIAAAEAPDAGHRTMEHVFSRGGPWYGTAPDDPTVVVRRNLDGSQTRGKIVNGEFVATPSRSKKRARRSA
jgi:hypothetical protein